MLHPRVSRLLVPSFGLLEILIPSYRYILKKTSHPTATGGSPIVTWLPNQLQAVMRAMTEVWEGSDKKLGKTCEEVMEATYAQKETLRKEVEKYCEERGEKA